MKLVSNKILALASILVLLPILLLVQVKVQAKGIYQAPNEFISEVFHGEVPKPKTVWLKAEDKKAIAEILSHQYNRLRIRYWQVADETVWILDEIGKEKPITIGVHIKADHIAQLKVLAFRESRGDEVRHNFFSDQFTSAKLTENIQLDQHIDGITGATMSVRATTKVARLALWLNKKLSTN